MVNEYSHTRPEIYFQPLYEDGKDLVLYFLGASFHKQAPSSMKADKNE